MIDNIGRPYRVAVTIDKRRGGDAEPYATITDTSWHEPDGSEITNEQRIAELEADQRQGSE